MISREKLIRTFAGLGMELSDFGQDTRSDGVMALARQENGWFTRHDMIMAAGAVRECMLDTGRLGKWLAAYPEPAAQKDVGVIMAGNIPLVGFFDLLCVLAAGHKCYYKPSSKDKVLMGYIAGLLRGSAPWLPLFEYTGQPLDAVIATGSDNTNRYFRSRYGAIPSLLRGSRTSAAILTGQESVEQLKGLAGDIFSYSGLGCRNVSHLLVPAGYDIAGLAGTLSGYSPVNPKYVNNYRQRSAVLKMRGSDFIDGGFFMLRENVELPAHVSEITYHYYGSPDESAEWIAMNGPSLQCLVHDPETTGIRHSRTASFGRSQYPGLTDYPDDKDVMAFLVSV